LTVHEIFGKLRYQYKWLIWWLIYKLFEKIIFSFNYDKYHCVSQNTAKDLIKNYKISQEKISIIYNGIDTEFWSKNKVNNKEIRDFIAKHKLNNEDKENFRFLYFWHAWKSKGIDYLIKALPEILKLKNISVILNIIESKRTNKILKRINTINSNRLKVFNWFEKKELRKLVASSDCVIAPSISEWFWSVHTEAVAMKKILITTNTSAIPEVVSWKVRFINPGNHLEIIKAVKDVAAWKYQKIPDKKFDWDSSVKKIEYIY